ncbi:MAG TPA: MFS transporter, partial [Caulobacteraceae bacterium]|nr:MFS transporter [Caulobacteraceae bacterium]
MATDIDAAAAGILVGPAPPKARHVVAVTVGNALEFYDFLTYAFFAAQIGRTFFPSTDASASLLASLATFGVGFVMRPIGAFVIGRIGDRVGRKPAMLLSFGLMGTAMVGLALTPSAHTIGLLAPALAILFRMIQGFALGGEVGPSTAYLIEAAPPHRRGLYVAFQYMSQDASVMVSGLVGFALSSALTDAQLDAWGWRVAFLLGGIIVPFGLILRRELVETLHVKPAPGAAVTPADVHVDVRLIAVLGFAMLAGGTIVSYVLNYLTTYSTQTLHMATRIGFLATIVTGLVGVLIDPLSGWLSDKYGRKPVMIAPWALLALVTVPGFWFLSHSRTGEVLVAMTVALSPGSTLGGAAVLTAVTE